MANGNHAPLITIIVLAAIVIGFYYAWTKLGLGTFISNLSNPTPSTQQGATQTDASTTTTPNKPPANTVPVTPATVTPSQSNPNTITATAPIVSNSGNSTPISQNNTVAQASANIVSNPQQPTQTLQQIENPVYNPNTPSEISPAPKTGILSGSQIASLFNPGIAIPVNIVTNPVATTPASVAPNAALSALENPTFDTTTVALVPDRAGFPTQVANANLPSTAEISAAPQTGILSGSPIASLFDSSVQF